MERQTENIYSATTCQAIDCGPGIRARQLPNKDPEPFLVRGGAFHEFGATYVKGLVRAGVECDHHLAEHILEEGLQRVSLIPTQEAILREHWSRWVRGFLLEHEMVGVEMGMAIDWNGNFVPFVDDLDHDTGNKARAAAAGFLWRGALDRVDLGSECEPGGHRITDIKTGMYIPSESELRQMFQPRQYCGAYALAHDLDRDSMIEFVWESAPWGVRVVVEYQVAHVVDDFLRWLEVFRGRDRLPPDDPYWTTPRRTDGCSVCPARKGCAAWEPKSGPYKDPDVDPQTILHMLEEDGVYTPGQASVPGVVAHDPHVEPLVMAAYQMGYGNGRVDYEDAPGPLLPRIARLESELKSARAEMRNHVKAHGELIELGHRAHPKPKERNDSDALALIKRLTDLGIPVDSEWLSVNLTKIQAKKKGLDPIVLGMMWTDGYLSKTPAGSTIVVDVEPSLLVPELIE